MNFCVITIGTEQRETLGNTPDRALRSALVRLVYWDLMPDWPWAPFDTAPLQAAA